jgi:L-lactate permease
MALGSVWTAIIFIIGLVISTIIIFIVTKLFGERESIKRAFITAVIGAVIYTVVYYLLGNGLLAAILGGIVWLISLRSLYKMDWLKSLVVALIIWIIASIVGVLLPTVSGPL